MRLTRGLPIPINRKLGVAFGPNATRLLLQCVRAGFDCGIATRVTG